MKIAIAGYGVEGEASYKYWSNHQADITIFDEKVPQKNLPDGVNKVISPNAFEQMQGFDLVVRTASLRPDKINTDGKIWSATNEFFEKCPAPIIGVTGTKGKGTTCSLITKILKLSGRQVHLLGNIGMPALDVLPKIKVDSIVVFELSSFQLWDLKKSPHIAVVLMVEPDHQDVHSSMKEYVDAKANIAKYQTDDDIIIYHPTNQLSQSIAGQSNALKLQYQTVDGAYIATQKTIGIQQSSNWIYDEVSDDETEWLAIDGQFICKISEVGLLGRHNLENICAAVTAAWQYTNDIKVIKRAVISFKGLPHRLQIVAKKAGITFIDDSFSSAPGATIAALNSFNQPITLICGGYDRGLDFSELIQAIAEHKNIEKVLLIGQTAAKLAKLLEANNFKQFDIGGTDFKNTVEMAAQNTQAGGVVLLSPGCASFDMFTDFKDRGDKFQKIVRGLA